MMLSGRSQEAVDLLYSPRSVGLHAHQLSRLRLPLTDCLLLSNTHQRKQIIESDLMDPLCH